MLAVYLGVLAVVGVVAGLGTGSVVGALEAVSVAFTLLMGVRVVVTVARVPAARVYAVPSVGLEVPDRIDRDHLPRWRGAWGEPLVGDLVDAVIGKIGVAADESAIHAFVQARLGTLRRQVAERYARCGSEIDTLSFEGVMGTILGLMVFLAQAAALFDLPLVDGADSAALVAAIVRNIGFVHLGTVMTAFITSLIGWGARAWLGGVVDGRQRAELSSLTAVEAWLQDSVLGRLHLPSRVTTVLELQEIEALTKPLVEALARIDLREVWFDVRYVEGGVRVVGRRAGLLQAVSG